MIKNYTEDELTKKFEDTWERISEGISSVQNPQAYLLGGVPGTGKTNAAKIIKKSLDRNVISIDIDSLREEHPRKMQLYKTYGLASAGHTNEFADELAQRIFDKAVENSFNIIRETTLKSSSGTIRQLKTLKENGYSSSVVIMVTDKQTSWAGNVNRYKKMNKAFEVFIQNEEKEVMPPIPRLTPKEIHEEAVNRIPKNAEKIMQSNLIDNLRVYSRESILENTPIFDSQVDKSTSLRKTLKEQLNEEKINQKKTEANKTIEFHPDTIKLKQQLEKSAESFTPEQREVYNERVEHILNEFNQERQQQAEQEKSQENEK